VSTYDPFPVSGGRGSNRQDSRNMDYYSGSEQSKEPAPRGPRAADVPSILVTEVCRYTVTNRF
jgi:hypothetical protein